MNDSFVLHKQSEEEEEAMLCWRITLHEQWASHEKVIDANASYTRNSHFTIYSPGELRVYAVAIIVRRKTD